MIAANQSITIQGENNVTQSAAGDFNLTQHFFQDDRPPFYEPSLEKYRPPQFPEPEGIETWIQILSEYRRILVCGKSLEDKLPLARHLAWQFHRHLTPSLGNYLHIKEWNGRPSDKELKQEIHRESQPTLYILPELRAREEGAFLEAIFADFQPTQWAILTSHSTRQDWSEWWAPLHAQSIEPFPNDVYSPPFLASYFRKVFQKHRPNLPEPLRHMDWEKPAANKFNLHCDEICRSLETPQQIEALIQLWVRIQVPSDPAMLKNCLNEAVASVQGKTTFVLKWFRQLKPDQQRLCFLLCFLNGCYEHQFFRASEWLIASTWRNHYPSHPKFDYADLHPFEGYLQQHHFGPLGKRLELKPKPVFKALLELLWQEQKRLIVHSLPHFITLIKAAAATPGSHRFTRLLLLAEQGEHSHSDLLKSKRDHGSQPSAGDLNRWSLSGGDFELFGDNARKDSFLEAMAQSFSLISFQDPLMLDRYLLEIASEQTKKAQIVIASALSTWLEFPNGVPKLLSKLIEWEKQTRSSRQQIPSGPSTVQDCIRATVLLCLGEIAAKARPNGLEEMWWRLLDEFSSDMSAILAKRLCYDLLPILISRHPNNSIPALYAFADNAHLGPTVAITVATLSHKSQYRNWLLHLLQHWHKKWQDKNSRPSTWQNYGHCSIFLTGAHYLIVTAGQTTSAESEPDQFLPYLQILAESTGNDGITLAFNHLPNTIAYYPDLALPLMLAYSKNSQHAPALVQAWVKGLLRYPLHFESLAKQWLQHAIISRAHHQSLAGDITRPEWMLDTIVKAIGDETFLVNCDPNLSNLVSTVLLAGLKEARHPITQQSANNATECWFLNRFEMLQPHFSELLAAISHPTPSIGINYLLQIYLFQRQEMVPSGETWNVGNKQYPFFPHARPATAIEDWIFTHTAFGPTPGIRKMALCGLLAILFHFDLAEIFRARGSLPTDLVQRLGKTFYQFPFSWQNHPSFLEKLILRWVSKKQPVPFSTALDLFPILLAFHNHNATYFKWFLHRWNNQDTLIHLGKLVKRFISKKRSVLVTILISVTAMLVFLLV